MIFRRKEQARDNYGKKSKHNKIVPFERIANHGGGDLERRSILAGGDYFTPDNASTLGPIRSLSDNGVIRIGGNTSERTI